MTEMEPVIAQQKEAQIMQFSWLVLELISPFLLNSKEKVNAETTGFSEISGQINGVKMATSDFVVKKMD